MKNRKEKNVNNKQKNKNNGKKKKDDVKSSIDSPFSLNWPSIDYGNYSQLVSCLKQSFTDYLTELKKSNDLKLCTESTLTKVRNLNKRLLSKAEPLCMIFGYNAVMRGLEKEKIKAVLVNADATPNMLIKSFIPICNLRSIPLIPVKNLSNFFIKEVSIKSTLVVGFTSSACEEKGPFHNLYTKCCKALGYDDCREGLGNKETSKHKEDKKKDLLKFNKQAKGNLLSLYHLKRVNRSNRVFQPPKREDSFGASFIKLDKSEPPKPSSANYGPKLNKRKASTELSFFIDVDNDSDSEDVKQEEVAVHEVKRVPYKRSTARYFEAFINSPAEPDPERKHYIPAKIKKVKASGKKRL